MSSNPTVTQLHLIVSRFDESESSAESRFSRSQSKIKFEAMFVPSPAARFRAIAAALEHSTPSIVVRPTPVRPTPRWKYPTTPAHAPLTPPPLAADPRVRPGVHHDPSLEPMVLSSPLENTLMRVTQGLAKAVTIAADTLAPLATAQHDSTLSALADEVDAYHSVSARHRLEEGATEEGATSS